MIRTGKPGDGTLDIKVIETALPILDVLAVFVFALTGALAAARLRQTLVTFVFFAVVTGVGGGTLRDLLIGAPVFWVHDSRVVLVCILASLAVWLTPQRLWPGRALEFLDGAGLVAYSVFGCWKALTFEVAPVPAVVMGIVTACMGGIIRDVLAGVPSILLRPELYVTASALAAAGFMILYLLGVPLYFAAGIAVTAGFALRATAIVWKLGLPNYRK